MAIAVRRARRLRGTEAVTLDTNAFAAFYDESLPLVYGYFLRRCGYRAQTAEDLTQETYLAAVRQIKQGTVVDAPLPWIYGIARHKLLDHFRTEGRRRDGTVPWDDDLVDGAAIAGAETDSAADWDRERVESALSRLPSTQRAVLVLRYMDGLSVPQIAETIGKGIHAVESLLARGRANLKRLLAATSESHHV